MKKTLLKKTVWFLFFLFAGVSIFYHSAAFAQIPGTHSRPYAYQTDLYSGRFSTSIPIFVPPGRCGLQPEVALTYSSATSNGIVGVGWSLDIGSIQKNTKFGTVTYEDAPYVLTINGAMQELTCIGGNEYRVKEEGAFYEIVRIVQTSVTLWEIWDKQGTYYRFDEILSGATGVFSCYLTKVLDINGNYMEINYMHDDTNLQVYPEQICYTGNQNEGDNPTNTVDFTYQARPDILYSWREGFEVITNKRLSQIDVKVNGETVRSYSLGYRRSIGSKRSVLISVQETGYDGGESDTLSPITATFGGFQLNIWDNYTWLTNFGASNYYPVMADYNGDGRTDCGSFNASNGYLYYGNSTGTGFETPTQRLTGLSTNKSFFGDFNGDGFTDAGKYVSNKLQIALGNGSSFGAFTDWLSGFSSGCYPYTGDFNGDGKTDVFLFEPTAGYWFFCFSDGTSFSWPAHWKTEGTGTSPFTGDFNGDGITDVGYYIPSSGSLKVAISYGAGLGPFTSWLSNSGFNCSLLTGDMNNDEMTDVIFYMPTAGYWFFCFSNGTAFGWPQHWISGYGVNGRGYTGDFDGDGTTDIGYFKYSNKTWQVRKREGLTADLIVQLNNGLGGIVDLTYTASSEFDNTGDDEQNDLALSYPVVTQMTTNDGLGNTTALEYFYEDGAFNMETKELRGFGYVKVTDPDENIKEVHFHQSQELKGKPYKEEVKDSQGNLYQKSESTWEYSSPYTGVYFAYLATQDTFLYDGDASYKQTRTNYTYDGWGNVTLVEDLGEYDQNGDEVRTYTEYTYNDTAHLHTHPSHIYIKDAMLNTVKETWFYYDNNPNYTDPPTKGLLTKEEHWLDGDNNPVITYAYNDYGNVISQTDANNNTVTTTYDAQTSTYPVTATNAKDQSITKTYNYKTGKVLTETDLNNQTVTYTYDVFGRLLKVIGPNDTEALPTVEYNYDTSTTPWKMSVKKRINSGASEVYTTYSFYDGLHRVVQVKTEAENSSFQILSGQKTFNTKGQVIKQYLPYLVTNTGYTYTTPDTNKPHTTYTYDAVGRVTCITAPDSTTTQTAYSDWTITVTDAQSKQMQKIFDAFGRVSQVKEFNSGQTYTTSYTYDTLGNLTQTEDTLGNTVTITYDTLGRKTAMNDADMGNWTYDYDANGNLTSQTDAKEQTISFTYDELNRLTHKSATGIDVTYTYDDAQYDYSTGRLCKVDDNSGSTVFEYDNLGREIKTTKTVDATPYVVERTYDSLGRITSITYPDTEVVNYTYNNQGHIESIASAATTYLSGATYNEHDQITQSVLGNDTTTDYTYNSQTLLLSHLVTTDANTDTIQDLSYSFDNVGNVSGIADNIRSTSQTFTYDDLHRLVTADGPYGNKTYSYNAIGNILSKDGLTFSYNSTRPHAVTDLSDGSNYTYDANGNMATRHTPSIDLEYLNYSVENKLVNIKDAFQNLVVEFAYDGDGGRTKKIVYDSEGEVDSQTTYIGSLYEIKDGVATKHIFRGSNRLATKTGGNVSFYHGDHLGSSNLLSDDNGLQVKRIEYEPFGTTYVDDGTVDTNYRYTGKELDASTGLYYYGARYYDAKLGRFTTADPTVQHPYDPQDLNRYSYCRNNPLKYTDPTGYGWFSNLCDWIKNLANKIERWLDRHHVDVNVQASHTTSFGAGSSSAAPAPQTTAQQDISKAVNNSQESNTITHQFFVSRKTYARVGFLGSQQFRNWQKGYGFVDNATRDMRLGGMSAAQAKRQLNNISFNKLERSVYAANFSAKAEMSYSAIEYSCTTEKTRAEISFDKAKLKGQIGLGKEGTGIYGEASFTVVEGSNEIGPFGIGDTKFYLYYDVGWGIGAKIGLMVDQKAWQMSLGGYLGPGASVEIRYEGE